MKIKKLELIGFKSFVDRTVLHFDHDVLGIVGPNGCGKSNIVDAIRWCMGEQSARHLRGRSMDDVIFSGSESRTPNEFAEVTLTFDNDAASELPLEYQHYAEIAVTRRLYRSGESDYLINGTAVRLRDVTDMFLGTGAGTKAYSIVEQGKVGLIVSAKPEDRRLLIEEAAGITKFKSRKKQAEKKMELTQQNLLRVGDIVAEIERSLASLKRQAAKAERFVAYRSELEDLRLHDASHKLLELVGWTKYESGEVERVSELQAKARLGLAERESEVEKTHARGLAAEETLEAAQVASIEAEQAAKNEEAAIARVADRLAALSQREGQAETEREEMSSQARALEGEQRHLALAISGLDSEERQRAEHLGEAESALAAMAVAHGDLEGRVHERRQRIAGFRVAIASGDAKMGGLERRQHETGARIERVRREREALEGLRGDLAPRASALQSTAEHLRAEKALFAGEKDRLEQLLPALKDRVRSEERALDDKKSEVSRKRSRLGALLEVQSRLEGVGAGTKALVGSGDPTVLGLVADRVEAPAHLTQALGGLLGGRLQHVVVKDLDRGVALLEKLAAQRKGRATVVACSPGWSSPSVKSPRPRVEDADAVGWLGDALGFSSEDEALVRATVGDALVVRDLAAARRLRVQGVPSTMVTLDGAVLHEDGRVEGGQGDALATGMLEGKREARELAKTVEALDGLVAASFQDLERSRGELVAVANALDRARQDAHARELALVSAEKDHQKAESQLETVGRQLDSLAGAESELVRSAEDANEECAGVAASLTESRTQLSHAEAELAAELSALTGSRERLDRQRQAATAGKVAIAGIREKLAAARATDARLARSRAELEERTARVSEELVQNGRAFRELSDALVVRREALALASSGALCAREELAKARSEYDGLRSVLSEGEASLKELRGQLDLLREELQSHEMALRERQLATEHLLATVRDQFRGLHLPLVMGDYHLRPRPDEDLRARADDLARLIERMGSVNLDAMREHAEAEERFTFYTTQKADLEKALTDLDRAIALMNRESRRLFEETFHAVNERFQEIFPRMFRGGRAELRMTEPNDTLDTGIDIIAQPPGKKLSSIELMSGGEKALTAVSLIFAIFQVKPSPFCILDEVDAPLDEANVARYNELIRSMTDRSQFILITHIKRTMQMVDVLYGVTMPEAGVSKIVSVKMNDTQSRGATRSEPEVAVA